MEAEAGVRPPPGAGQQEPENPAGRAPPPPHRGEGAPGSPAPPDRPPPHWGEAMLESPAPADRPPRNGVSEPPQHRGEGAPGSPAPPDRPPRNRHWGEGMLDSPAPRDRPPHSRASEPPRHWGEEMLDSPVPQDRPPHSRASGPPRHWGEEMLDSPVPRDRPPHSRASEPPRHWGEEMLDSPVPQDRPPHSRASGPPRHWGEEMLDSPVPRDRPPHSRASGPPRHWGEEMLDSPAPRDQRHNNGVSEPPRQPQHWGEGLLALAPGAPCPPRGRLGEQPQRPSQRGGEKPEPAQAGNLAPKEPGGPPGAGEQALLAMLRAVASSPLPVRSQQKDEPDLTAEEKLGILRALYRDKPVVFLERFRRALRVEHLGCFAHLAARYEVRFYCDEVRRAGRAKAGRTRVRNKRYAALQQLIKGGEYFSDEQMRAREPLLYEQYIGQYLSEEELLALGSQAQAGPCSLSGVLMDSYQEQVLQLRLHIQQEQEHACMEEEEEEDDDEGEGSSSASDSWVPDTEEKAFLREEFTSRMHQRFLDGKDRDFDYSEVDENPEFDNLDIVTRDEEERYFDGEESEEAEEMEAE